VSRVGERMGSETTAVSFVRRKDCIYLIDETRPALPSPPCLPTAPRTPCREALLTGRGVGCMPRYSPGIHLALLIRKLAWMGRGARTRKPPPCLGGPRVAGRGRAAAEGSMTIVIYGDETGALLATVETADAIKDQLFDA
jgi:hypothetical protein